MDARWFAASGSRCRNAGSGWRHRRSAHLPAKPAAGCGFAAPGRRSRSIARRRLDRAAAPVSAPSARTSATGTSSVQAGSSRLTNSPSKISSGRSISSIAHRNLNCHVLGRYAPTAICLARPMPFPPRSFPQGVGKSVKRGFQIIYELGLPSCSKQPLSSGGGNHPAVSRIQAFLMLSCPTSLRHPGLARSGRLPLGPDGGHHRLERQRRRGLHRYSAGGADQRRRLRQADRALRFDPQRGARSIGAGAGRRRRRLPDRIWRAGLDPPRP